MLSRKFIQNHLLSVSIVLFMIIYSMVHFIQPGFLYDNNNTLREFGLNSKKKTILPAWLLAIFIAVISYLSVMYYLAIPKLYR